jgi:hypothetical protein
LDQLDTELRTTYDSGKEVWLEATAIDELNSISRGAKWFELHAQPNALHERRDRGYNIRFIKIVP